MISRYASNKPVRESGPRSNKIWMKPSDQMDLWLDSQGYYRKHTAKDGTCLYRAVSEQIFLAQAFHLDVRRHSAEFAQRHPELLSSVSHCSVNEYVEQIKHPYESGGKLELELMSLMYRRDFLVFHEVGKGYEQVTNNGFDDHIMLCLTQDRHYDSVYTKQFISTAAYCQSLVYDMLYKGVFELQEVDYAVKKMLHDKSSKYQRDPSSFLINGLALRLEIRDSYVNVKDLLSLGVTPFPYKVAKSLDSEIYRNVEYDTWNDIRRGLRYGAYFWNNQELQVGVKCLVNLESDTTYHAHIQEMVPNKGPVVVFIEELGQKMSVSYESLELLPQPPQPPAVPLPLKHLRQLQIMKALSSQESLNQADVKELHSSNQNEKDHAWRNDLETDGRTAPKMKMFSEQTRLPNKRPSRMCRSKTKEYNAESNKNQMEACSVVSSSDSNYQQQEITSYYPSNFEGSSSQEHLHQEVNGSEPMDEEPCVGEMHHGGAPQQSTLASPMVCLEPPVLPPPPHYYVPDTSYCAYLPHKPSHLPDSSELPVPDMSSVRFFYNYGVDHYPRTVRPTPPCFLNTTVAYMPDPNLSPSVYEHVSSPMNTPEPAVVMSPVGVCGYAQRPDSLPVLPTLGPGPTFTGEMVPDTTSHSHPHLHPHQHSNIAPRFKNKFRTVQGRPYDPPVIQQPEISSTTNIPVGAHYLPPPMYYHPMECEPYCPTSYIEYSLYDPTTTLFYPSVAPAHYFHPDALYCQHLIATPSQMSLPAPVYPTPPTLPSMV